MDYFWGGAKREKHVLVATNDYIFNIDLTYILINITICQQFSLSQSTVVHNAFRQSYNFRQHLIFSINIPLILGGLGLSLIFANSWRRSIHTYFIIFG